jgi:hypothetical protein
MKLNFETKINFYFPKTDPMKSGNRLRSEMLILLKHYSISRQNDELTSPDARASPGMNSSG